MPPAEHACTIVGPVIALLVPGQGSQRPGMLTPWLGRPEAREELREWSALVDLDLLWLGTGADAAQVLDTAVAQPLLTALALISGGGIELGADDLVCGHSVGEIGALGLAGVLERPTAVRLAAARGAAMAAAAAQAPTGLAAVLGGDETEVLRAVDELGLVVATVNTTGQVVVGGAQEQLDRLTAQPPTGARVRPLAAAGAFHTGFMASAVPAMRELVAAITPAAARCRVVTNAEGRIETDGRALLDGLVGQLTGSVRFDRCLQTIAAAGPAAVIEVAPGGTLAPIARRAVPSLTADACRALSSPADLPVAV